MKSLLHSHAISVPNSTDIQSTGPLTDIWIGPDLSCQVIYNGGGQFYYAGDTPANCGTFIFTGGTLYGPNFSSEWVGTTTAFSGTQSAISGAGTTSSPYSVTTTAAVGSTGLTVAETDSYVVGSESYRTDVQISNSTSSPQSLILYRAADCYLSGSDSGYGFTSAGAVACAQNANNSPPALVEEWAPITSGSSYIEDGYGTVWSAVNSQTPFPNTCQCTTYMDNGGGLSWSVNVPANASVTISHLMAFSAVGNLALTAAISPDSATAWTGGTDGYTVTISNPNAIQVTLNSVSVSLQDLLAGFNVVAGSSTINSSPAADPTISGSLLTWTSASLVVPASGTLNLHFLVSVSAGAGTYQATASADGGSYSVSPASATITVQAMTVCSSVTPTATGTSTATGTPTSTPTAAFTVMLSLSSTSTPMPCVTATPTATPTLPPTPAPTATSSSSSGGAAPPPSSAPPAPSQDVTNLIGQQAAAALSSAGVNVTIPPVATSAASAVVADVPVPLAPLQNGALVLPENANLTQTVLTQVLTAPAPVPVSAAINPNQGGVVVAGNVAVSLPPAALTGLVAPAAPGQPAAPANVAVNISTQPQNVVVPGGPMQFSPNGTILDISITNASTGQPITTFPAPVPVVMKYNAADVGQANGNANELTAAYIIDANSPGLENPMHFPIGTFVLFPPSNTTLDTTNGTITVQTQAIGSVLSVVTNPVGYVQTTTSDAPELSSFNTSDAQTFGTKPQFSYLQVVEPQIGTTLLVRDPDTGNYAYVNASDVGPSGPPPSNTSTAVVRGLLYAP